MAYTLFARNLSRIPIPSAFSAQARQWNSNENKLSTFCRRRVKRKRRDH